MNLDDGETIPLVKFTRPSLASTLERSEARLSLRIQPDWSQMVSKCELCPTLFVDECISYCWCKTKRLHQFVTAS